MGRPRARAAATRTDASMATRLVIWPAAVAHSGLTLGVTLAYVHRSASTLTFDSGVIVIPVPEWLLGTALGQSVASS